jgi:hypothetical protein
LKIFGVEVIAQPPRADHALVRPFFNIQSSDDHVVGQYAS